MDVITGLQFLRFSVCFGVVLFLSYILLFRLRTAYFLIVQLLLLGVFICKCEFCLVDSSSGPREG